MTQTSPAAALHPSLPEGLWTGERAPEFTRMLPGGGAATFYEMHCGRPLLLLTGLPRPSEAAAVLAALCAVRDSLDHPADVACLTGADTPDLPGLPGVDMIPDDGRIVRVLNGADNAPQLLVFDRCLRLKGRVALDLNMAVSARALLGAPDRPMGPAPVLLVPDVVDPGLCADLITAWTADNDDSGMLRPQPDGNMALVPDATAKKRRDHILRDPTLTDRVLRAMHRRLLPEIAKAFHFQVTRYETLKVVAYDAGSGGWFRLHRDNNTPDAAHRRFAVTLALNDTYEGGWLRFPEYNTEGCRPPAGGAVVFSCSHLHELTDVTAGRRHVLLTFF